MESERYIDEIFFLEDSFTVLYQIQDCTGKLWRMLILTAEE